MIKKEYTISIFEIEDIKTSVKEIERQLEDIKMKLKIITNVK
jgi:hypothetical protein